MAFIDDDEEASVGWLRNLVHGMAETGADVVFGPVRADLRRGGRARLGCARPTCIPSASSSERPAGSKPATWLQQRCSCGASGSAVSASIPALTARTGGEDTQFFFEMQKPGEASARFPAGRMDDRARVHRPGKPPLASPAKPYGAGQSHARLLRTAGERSLS